MPYFDTAGLREGEQVVLVPSGSYTADGDGAPHATGAAATLRLTLNVTAASGTGPTMTATVQHSEDGTTWRNHTSFAAATAVGTQRLVLSALDRFVRCSWTVGGTTPSFTFSVTGELI
jgi:hypothetical protein